MRTDQLSRLSELAAGLHPVIAIVLIVLGAVVTVRLSAFFIHRGLAVQADRLLGEVRRRTLESLLENLIRYVVYVVALTMILRELHVDATAILASAGVVGLAVGLGAQSLIRDVIAGFFLISEGLIHVGDVITFDSHTGAVERVNIRTTQIRTADGEVWTIPNGRLEVFGNKRPRPPARP